MKTYETTAVLRLHDGNLTLDDEQARRRAHLLRDNEDGTHAIVHTVWFKAGETFGYDRDIPKALAHAVKPPSGALKKKKSGKETARESTDAGGDATGKLDV